MNGQDTPHTRKSLLRDRILKGLFLYALVPVLFLLFFTDPVGRAAGGSAAAVWLILLAALCAVALNELVYALIRRKRPSLLVFAWGAFCLLLVTLTVYFALPASLLLASSLAVIAGCLTLAFLFLLSYWLAPRRSKAAHVFAVGLWITIGIIAVCMLYQVIRDFEIRYVTADTWITLAILLALIPAAFAYKIRASRRRKSFRRKAEGLAEGRILQIIGETRLDMDDDLVTDYHARVRYEVGGVSYETRAPISKLTWRRFGKQAFVGQSIPVHYDPDDPASAYSDRIDRHFFDSPEPDSAG